MSLVDVGGSVGQPGGAMLPPGTIRRPAVGTSGFTGYPDPPSVCDAAVWTVASVPMEPDARLELSPVGTGTV